MWSSAAVPHLLQVSTCCVVRDGILHTLVITSGYLRYNCISIISNLSAHPPLTSTRHFLEIQFLSTWFMFPSLFQEGCSSTFVRIMNVQVIGVWWCVFGSRSAFKVTPEVFSWDQDLSFCRPVKFFHTDWIIISLWSLPYTQRHCHVGIEKGSVQTVAIKLEAHNSLEYHYMLKH